MAFLEGRQEPAARRIGVEYHAPREELRSLYLCHHNHPDP